jgi:hypothetical protein
MNPERWSFKSFIIDPASDLWLRGWDQKVRFGNYILTGNRWTFYIHLPRNLRWPLWLSRQMTSFGLTLLKDSEAGWSHSILGPCWHFWLSTGSTLQWTGSNIWVQPRLTVMQKCGVKPLKFLELARLAFGSHSNYFVVVGFKLFMFYISKFQFLHLKMILKRLVSIS